MASGCLHPGGRVSGTHRDARRPGDRGHLALEPGRSEHCARQIEGTPDTLFGSPLATLLTRADVRSRRDSRCFPFPVILVSYGNKMRIGSRSIRPSLRSLVVLVGLLLFACPAHAQKLSIQG